MKQVRIPTDVGDLIIDENNAKALRAHADSIAGTSITPEMLDAGCEASWMLLPGSNRWRRDEVEGIIKRVYIAMRAVEFKPPTVNTIPSERFKMSADDPRGG